jgi:hypothetical protein
MRGTLPHPREALPALIAALCTAMACASSPAPQGTAAGTGGTAPGGAGATSAPFTARPAAAVQAPGAGPLASAVAPGMDVAAARRAWGEPAAVRRLPSPAVRGLVYERWTWSGGREALIVEGQVVDVLVPAPVAGR